ncbi:hypothetical protein BH11PLA1_BH11PLA1_24070 [soil metagenome]
MPRLFSRDPAPRAPNPAVLQGTLEVMLLSVLAHGDLHGYALARAIERRSDSVLMIEEGSLYPALHRLTKRGDLAARWELTDTGRRARMYHLTNTGRQALEAQRSLWDRVARAVDKVVGTTPEGDAAGAWRLA